MLKADDEVVGKPYQKAVPSHPWLHFSLEPDIQYIVEIDVRQQGADDPALWRSFVTVADLFSFQDAGMQPLADQPQYPTIVDPALDEVPQPAPVKVVEESCNVCVVNPSDAARRVTVTLYHLH